VQRLKDFMHPTMHSIAFCGRAVPRCLSLATRWRVLSKQREMRRCVRVALLCIQEKPQRRPDMPEVTRMLSSTKKAVFPRRLGYATESPMYAGAEARRRLETAGLVDACQRFWYYTLAFACHFEFIMCIKKSKVVSLQR
jgi:hypothetical protein